MSAFADLLEIVRHDPDARWTAEDLVMAALDKHAHELAEKIRESYPVRYTRGDEPSGAGRVAHDVANLIDPEVN